MSDVHAIRAEKPTHPGKFIKRQVIGPARLSVTRAADALGVTRVALSAVLNERARVSPEMALRFEKAFGIPMEGLMRMQNAYDIAAVREREHEIEVVRVDPAALSA
jgi:addiction module HigA family antidote